MKRSVERSQQSSRAVALAKSVIVKEKVLISIMSSVALKTENEDYDLFHHAVLLDEEDRLQEQTREEIASQENTERLDESPPPLVIDTDAPEDEGPPPPTPKIRTSLKRVRRSKKQQEQQQEVEVQTAENESEENASDTRKIFSCCNLYFSSKKQYHHHLETTHHLDLSLICFRCDKTFSRNNRLMDHIYEMHPEFCTYICDTCPFKTCYEKSLKFHSCSKFKNKFSCKKCNYKGKSEKDIRSHKNKEHPEEGEYQEQSCPTCDRKFIRKDLLSDHILEKHPELCTYVCKTCTFKTYYENSLKNHSCHKSKNKYSCKKCNYRGKSANDIRSHRDKQHPKYCCQNCNFKTNRRGEYFNHEKKHQTPFLL